jgi:hypothetical protein
MPQKAVGNRAGSRADHYRRTYCARWRRPLATNAIADDTGHETTHLNPLAS